MCEIASLGPLDAGSAKGSVQHPSHTSGSYGWLTHLLNSGEAVACLSLSGNHAVSVKPDQLESTISYTVRHKEGENMVALTPTFNFSVIGIFGSEKGRALCVRPHYRPSSVYMAFRGVRLDIRKTDPVADAQGPALDRANFKATEPAAASWLGEGYVVHSGVLDHLESIWNSGLRDYFAELSRCTELRIPFRGAYVHKLLLVGLSFGGALAELTALRAAVTFPPLSPIVHVLSFGSVPWASPAVTARFDDIFGRRSVQLVNSMRRAGPRPEGAGWWLAASRGGCGGQLLDMLKGGEMDSSIVSEWLSQSLMHWLAPNDSRRAGNKYVVFDPLVASSSDHFVPLQNLLACSKDKDNKASVDPAATSCIGKTHLDHRLLSDFIDGALPPDHAFWEGYNSLHYGARYRDLLIGFLLKHRDVKAAAASERVRRQRELKQRRQSGTTAASHARDTHMHAHMHSHPCKDSPKPQLHSPQLTVATAPVVAAANMIAAAMGHIIPESEGDHAIPQNRLTQPPMANVDPRAHRANIVESELNALDDDDDAELCMF